MSSSRKFIPVMLTPFNEKGAIDFDALSRLTEYYISAGAKGLFANCLSSEMYELSPEERHAITQFVVRVANGRIPVVATGSFDRETTPMVEFIKRQQDTGVNAVILTTSMLAQQEEPDDLLEERFHEILLHTNNLDFGFYECPRPYKRLVSPDLLSRLLKSNRVSYFKDTSLTIDLVRQKINAGQGFQFGLYDAYMVHAVESLKAGAAGLSCIQGNYFPELIVWLCNNFSNNSLTEQVERVQDFFRRNMEIMHNRYPFTAKEILQKRGLNIQTTTRINPPAATSEDLIKMNSLLSEYHKLEEELLLTIAI